ncbi:MAG: alpha/beta hydrolase [Thermoleophilia bacterium]|nr:alpha/beta hydrolase [Thermoleophilia bacterium]
MHVVVRGEGPDVVLIHGSAGSLRDFTFSLAPRLARQFRVLAVDRPGHGWSGTGADSDRLSTQARMVRQAAAVMGAARPIVVGHSYGAAVGLRWALDAPNAIAGLVAVAPVSHPWTAPLPLFYRISSNPVLRHIANPFVAAWVPARMIEASVAGVFAPDPVPDGYVRHFGVPLSARLSALTENARQRRALRREVSEMARGYRGMTTPVEIVHGDRDPVVGLDHHARALVRDIPEARLTVLEGIGHMPHHAGEDAVVAAVRRLADRPVPDSPAVVPRAAASSRPQPARPPGPDGGSR